MNVLCIALIVAVLHLMASPSLGFAALGSSSSLCRPGSSTSCAVDISASGTSACIPCKYPRGHGGAKLSSLGLSFGPVRVGKARRFGSALTIRGGAAADDDRKDTDSDDDEDISDVESSSDSSESSEEEEDDESVAVEAEVVDGPWANAAASASKLILNDESTAESSTPTSGESVAAESQRSSYFLSSLLWSSLVLDCILNKPKRKALFGSMVQSAIGGGEAQNAMVAFDGSLALTTAAPTAALAAGYALAGGIAFLLSRPAPTASDGDDATFAASTRKRMALGLALFGAVNLFATAGSTPYLGLSGAVINGHNALVALNGWSKDVSADRGYAGDLLCGIKDSVRTLTSGSKDESDRFTRLASTAFLLATFSAIVRSGQIVKEILSSQGASALSIARLGRFVLASTVLISLKEAVDARRMKGLLLLGAGGLVSLCSAGVAVPMMMADVGMRKVTSNAGKLLLLSVVAGALSLSKMLVGKQK